MSHGCVHPESSRPRSAGFTLVELLVSMAVLALMLVLLASMSDQVMRTWKRSAAHAQSWQEGRAALELISRRITQATLNPHWTYDNAAQPTRYLRHSDLHFLIEPARQLLGPQLDGKAVGPGSAVFFQALLGVTTEADRRSLTGMLNTCGFFITRYTESSPLPNATASSDRYRLMEVLAPAEEMRVYGGAGKAWAITAAAAARPLAENIILLVVRPIASIAGELEPIGLQLAYDSTSNATQDPQPSTANQLPPIVEIIVVAIDEASAERFNTLTLPSTASFLESAHFERDLQTLEQFLISSRVEYRVLRNRVTLSNSTWNG